MAFNPFTSFRKYQRFWMACVLLLSMVTFVLCTGVGGDLSQRLLHLFARQEGTPLARVNGRNLFGKELTELREQRNLVNEFMKRSLEVALKNIHDIESSGKLTAEQRQKELPILMGFMKPELEKRLLKQRYFGSGVKLDDLVDFMVWRHEADLLGVRLQPENVLHLLNLELFADHGIYNAFNNDLFRGIIRELRSTSQRVPTEALLLSALTDEFRVRIAQLSLAYADPNLFRRTRERFQEDFETRIVLSPAMLWDVFKANRSEFDVTLLPVDVENFVKDMPAPTPTQLRSLFDEGRATRPDPTSPKPGFEILPSVRAELIVGDPDSAKFKHWAKMAILLQATPPAWIPTSPLTTLARYIGGPLAERQSLQDSYYNYIKVPSVSEREGNLTLQERRKYLTARWTEGDAYWAMASKLASKYPEAAVSWIAGYAQPSNWATAQLGFAAYGPARHSRELALGAAEEAKERTPPYATIIASGAAAPGLISAGMLDALNDEMYFPPRYFPLDVVVNALVELQERRQAEQWVHSHMMDLRAKLNEFVGNKAKYERELKNNLDRMGLERYVTKDFYNKFDINKAPKLQPLVKSFDKWLEEVNKNEGRNLTPENLLKEGDFYKLFFDAAENFSAAGSTYKVRPWPPVVTLKKGFGERDLKKAPQVADLFDKAVEPMLFWKIEDRPGKVPESIDLVKDRVEGAWKFIKARDDKALPKAKEIAQLLQKSEEGFAPVIVNQTFELKKAPIVLRHLATLYTQARYQDVGRIPEQGNRDYTSFTLPKDTFVYPRDDMSKEILSLRDLKKPIVIGYAPLDEINKALFETSVKNGRVVQVLTNKPHSVFYVACVTGRIPALPSEFQSVMKYAARSPALGGAYMDRFFDRAFDEEGKKLQASLMSQLRAQTDSEVLADAPARESFDHNETL